MPPYLPFLEALGSYIRLTPADRLREQTGPIAGVLSGLFPELIQKLGDVPASPPILPEQAKLRLFEAITQFIQIVSDETPVVLILDDLHWAESATCELLTFLARNLRGMPVFILGAYRLDEATSNTGLQRTIYELNRLRVMTTFTLKPLPTTALLQMAMHEVNGLCAASVGDALFAHSEGNPFFAEELLRAWVEVDAFTHLNGAWQLQQDSTTALPSSIASAIQHRLAHQPQQTQEVLYTASIIGQTFDVALLAHLCLQPVEVIEALLEAAVRAHLIQPTGDGTFAFQHYSIREVLHAGVGAVRRQQLHAAIGHWLEANLRGPLAQQAAVLALHFAQSGDHDKAIGYTLQAATQAMSAYAFEEAAHSYQSALTQMPSDHAQRGEVLMGLGQAHMLTGHERDPVTTFEAARAWFKYNGDGLASARAAHQRGLALWRLEDLPAARAAFEMALSTLKLEPAREAVQVGIDLGSLLAVSLHQQQEGIGHVRRALNLAHQLEEPRLMASSQRALGNLLVRANKLSEGIPLLEQALALASSEDDFAEAVECCANLSLAWAWSGDFNRANQIGEQWEGFAKHSNDRYQLRHTYAMRAMGHIVCGRWAQAEASLDKAQHIAENLASADPTAVVTVIRGVLAFYRGQFSAAEVLFEEASQVFRSFGPGAVIWYLGLVGASQALQGNRAEASACADELEALLQVLPAGTMPTAEPTAHLVTIALALNDGVRLTRYYAMLNAFRGQYHDAVIDRLLGCAELALGDLDAAQHSLARAEAFTRRQDAKPELAQTLAAQAELAHKQGAVATALDKQSQALTLFQLLGNTFEANRTRTLFTQLGSPSTQLPAGLSAREAEVLRLLAQGHNNRAIAQTLLLSEKTVANHITHIFTILSVENRAGATAFAVRQGLA